MWPPPLQLTGQTGLLDGHKRPAVVRIEYQTKAEPKPHLLPPHPGFLPLHPGLSMETDCPLLTFPSVLLPICVLFHLSDMYSIQAISGY